MVFLFHKPAARERYSVSLMHLNGEKQPAGCQKSSVCLCKKQVFFLEPRGKERHKQRRLA